MERIIASASLLLGVSLIGLGFGPPRAQEPARVVKMVPVRAVKAVSGQALFREYCAVCHGVEGKGDGPAAAALRTAPPDLTGIARNNGGRFPEIRVQNAIAGEADRGAAHGSAEMPAWNSIFRHMANDEMAPVRVYNLMKYIEEIQAP